MAKLSAEQQRLVDEVYRGIYGPDYSNKYPGGIQTQEQADEFYKSVGISAPPPATNGKSSSKSLREQRAEQLAEIKRQAESAKLPTSGGTILTPVNVPGQPNGSIVSGKDESQLPAGVYPKAPGGEAPSTQTKPSVLISDTGKIVPKPMEQSDRMLLGRTPQTMAGVERSGGGGAGSYTVQSGDTLSAIAKRVYGDSSAYRMIANANGISNPNRISVGQTIRLPSQGGGSSQPSAPATAPKPSSGGGSSSQSSGGGSSRPSSGGGTILGSSSGNSYNVGQTYSAGGYTYTAQSDGSFKKSK